MLSPAGISSKPVLKKNSPSQAFASRFIFLISLLWTAVAGFATIKIYAAHLENAPFFFDPVGYLFHNAVLYLRVLHDNPLGVAWQEWIQNAKYPLRTVPVLLLNPELLAHPLGHLATGLPCLFLFLFVLGKVLYQRTHQLLYALGGISIFASLPGLYDLETGLGVYWLDLPAALLIGAATLCLIGWWNSGKAGWLISFSVLTSFSLLSRYTGASYLAVLCGPVLVFALVDRWKRSRNWSQAVFAPLVTIAVILLGLAGNFVFSHLKENAHYYSTFGYSLGSPDWRSSVELSVPPIFFFMSRSLALLFMLCAAVQIFFFLRDKDKKIQYLVISVWLMAAVSLFQIFILRMNDNKVQFVYGVMPCFFALLSPVVFSLSAPQNQGQWLRGLGIVLLLASVLSGWRSFTHNYHHAVTPSAQRLERKNMDKALASFLVKEGKEVVWCAFFDEYAWIPSMEAFYETKQLPLPAGTEFFTIHQKYWEAFYPGLGPEEVAKTVWDKLQTRMDVVVVFEDVSRIDNQFDNDYSRKAAKFVAEKIPQDPSWEKIFTLNTLNYGTLNGYRRRTSEPGLYAKVFERNRY